EDAVWSYRRALAINPLDVAAHESLNQLLFRLDRGEEFLQSYDQAAAAYPDASILSLGRADLLLKNDRFEEAREAYGSVAARESSNVFAFDGLAMALMNLRDYEGAIAAQEHSLKLDPSNSGAWSNLAIALIGAGEGKRAIRAAEEALARDPANQAALANLGTAYRISGDSRDEQLTDYESMIQVFEIEPPQGYSDMESFNRDLNAYLDRLHFDKHAAVDQTLRGGTQTLDDLFGSGHKPAELLRAQIDKAVAQYIARMKDDAAHPLFGRRTKDFRHAASWSSRLHDCGYHTNHMHPKGWISSAYYVALPPSVTDENSKEGWIKFGEPGIESSLKDAVRRSVQPKAGRLVLFPSYMWHGTIPFHAQTARTTIAFDVVPR
ncbi:MAG TPA: putative 2OG-Fe(II) oxygenase, partial [Rhizomicrobium sp.]|nr:putative 2OG-Fe(II) oxygenase [Rhizomicrobium sp.]